MTRAAEPMVEQAAEDSAPEASGEASPDVENAEAVQLRVTMPKEDYDLLLEGARIAGLPPEEFLIQAIAEGTFIAKSRRKGNRIYVQSRRGLRELVG